MPYLTGTQFDFQNRIHQFLQSGLDMVVPLSMYQQESGLYTGVSLSLVNTWQREINHKLYQISGIPSYNG